MSLVLAVVTALSVSTPATAGHDPGFDPAAFANPPKDSLPAIYWYWNNTITSDITDHQMAEMRAKGVYEAVIFPLGGDSMKPVFLSEDWFTLVGHVLREAQRTGMKMWLFNDNNFPSGRGANYVVNGGTLGNRTIPARPDLRLKGLLRSTRIVTGPSTLKLAETSGLSVDTGKLVVDPATAPGAAPLTPGAGWTDYTVGGKVTLTAGGVQLAVRSDGTHGYLVDVDPKGAASVYKVDGPNRTRLTTGVNTPGFTPTHVQTVSVTVAGNTITPKINNTVQPAATDTSFPAGAAAVSAEGTQRSLWDDLTVTAPDGAKLWSSTFDNATALAGFAQNRVHLAGVTAAAARPVGTTAAVELNGSSWQVPAGTWQVDVYSQVLLRDDSSGYVRGYLDLLDPKATDAFLSIAPEEYARRFPWAMGTVVPGFWDDEPFIASAQPHPFKRLPSSPGLADAVRAAGGTPGVAYTAAADGLDAVADQAAGTYWRAVDNLFSTSYYQREADWMAQHGLKLISNPLLDEQGPQQRMNSTGDLSKDNQWAQVPGSDMITTDYTAGEQTTLARNASSAAHQSGAPRSLMETFGNAGWQVAPDYMHATVGALATRGVNLTFLHAMYTDETSVTFAPPIGPRSTFWEDMPDVDAWIGRVMELGRGTNLAKTALVQPQRAAEQTRVSDTAHQLDKDFSATAFALERGQVDFDLLSDSSLSGDPAARFQAQPRGGTLRVGEADYRLAVLPRTPVLDLATVRTLAKFVQTGGRLIAVGPLPTREATGRDADLARELKNLSGAITVVTDVNTIAGLAQNAGLGAARLQPAADAVRVQRTGRGADTAFLLNNESDAVVTTTATFPIDGTPEIWDPRTGTTKVATAYTTGRTTTGVPVTLQPYETLGVVFRKGVRDTAHLTDGTLPADSVSADRRGMQATLTATAPGTYPLTGQANGRTYRGTARVTDPLAPIALAGPWTVRLEQDGAVAT